MNRKKVKKVSKIPLVYLGLSLFFVIFTIVYEKFSFGESSLLMRTMFLSPLVAGVVTPLFEKQVWAKRLLAWSVATFVSGGLVNGIIEVSGRESDFIAPYYVLGSVLLFISVILIVLTPKTYQN